MSTVQRRSNEGILLGILLILRIPNELRATRRDVAASVYYGGPSPDARRESCAAWRVRLPRDKQRAVAEGEQRGGHGARVGLVKKK